MDAGGAASPGGRVPQPVAPVQSCMASAQPWSAFTCKAGRHGLRIPGVNQAIRRIQPIADRVANRLHDIVNVAGSLNGSRRVVPPGTAIVVTALEAVNGGTGAKGIHRQHLRGPAVDLRESQHGLRISPVRRYTGQSMSKPATVPSLANSTDTFDPLPTIATPPTVRLKCIVLPSTASSTGAHARSAVFRLPDASWRRQPVARRSRAERRRQGHGR